MLHRRSLGRTECPRLRTPGDVSNCGNRTAGISGIYAPGQLYPGATIKKNNDTRDPKVYRTDTRACFHNKSGVKDRYFCSQGVFFCFPRSHTYFMTIGN